MTTVNNSNKTPAAYEHDRELSQRILCGDRDAAIKEFHERFLQFIKSQALYHCYKIPFNRALDWNELQREAFSEAYLASFKAVTRYDGESCSLKTFIANSIEFHFRDLRRAYTKRSSREILVQKNESNDAITSDEIATVEADLCKGMEDYSTRAMYFKEAYRVLKYHATEKANAYLSAMYEAYRLGLKSPVQHAATLLGCSKTHVNNIRKALLFKLPSQLRKELHDTI